jgi:hypothetical protein
MPCGCGGKRKGGNIVFDERAAATGDPLVWGPALWSILHILAFRIGHQGMDMDQARDIQVLVTMLPQIIPCTECQGHSKTYLAANPFEPVKNVDTLSVYIKTWLLIFHNAVRTQKGQPIEITTLEELDALYANETIQKCQLNTIIANVSYGIRNGIVKVDAWKRWFTILNRLKVMSLA